MKNKKHFSKSLTSEFTVLLSIVLAVLTLANIGLVFYQNQQLETFQTEMRELERKERLALELQDSFNLAISEMRGYFAYRGESVYYQQVEQQKSAVSQYMQELQLLSSTPEDRDFNQQARNFYAYYFNGRVPTGKANFDSGNLDALVASAVADKGSETIRSFQSSLRDYTEHLAESQSQKMAHQNQQALFTQIIFALLFFALVGILAVLIRKKIRAIGEPLNELTKTASLIAEGEQVVFMNQIEREDELGLLSLAFEQMSKSILENEEELQAQNEELIAQQETLQMQQGELEEALALMGTRENELKRRNELIHGLANSLDKQKVLQSIVTTLLHILRADKGVVRILDDAEKYSSIGISKEGIGQFNEALNGSLMTRLNELKKSYTVKRESFLSEKGYHTGTSYSYDLYIPILNTSEEIIGVMAFTRYGQAFNSQELAEYDQLSKQIAISLDNLKLFEQTEEDRKLNQQIMDNIQEGIQLLDNAGSIITVNRMMASMAGEEATSLRRLPFEEWATKWSAQTEKPETTKDLFHSLLFTTSSGPASFLYKQLSPEEKVVEVYSEPLIQNEERTGTILVHRDITREFEVDAMKSEFVSTVSHELRTPLASVLGFAELLIRKELKPEKQKKYLETIHQEASRLTNLINDFLDVQRMEAGKQTYEHQEIDMEKVLKKVCEIYQPNHPRHPLSLKVDVANPVITGDEEKIEQVLTNLISNAIKYSPDGGPVKLRVFEETDQLKVSVEDQGLGIPQEGMGQLFTKFYRVDNSDLRKIGGTGLGLSIVKEILKAHGGDVSAESEVGKGSIFTVSFPKSETKERNKATTLPEGKEEGKTHLMIIEDDASHAQLLRDELQEAGFSISVYPDAETALTSLDLEKPEAIVVDIQLGKGKMSGWDFIAEARKKPEMKHTPVFISSANEERKKAREWGAEEYFIKPYQPSKLSKIIRRTLELKNKEGHFQLSNDHVLWDLGRKRN